MDKESKRIIRVLIAVSALFISVVVYISYFQIFIASEVKNNSYNKRLWLDEESILRGSIMDRNQKILVHSEINEGGQTRYYGYGSLYSHIIGYSFREYGKAGIEASYNDELLALGEENPLNRIRNAITDYEGKGNNVVLTIDHELQKLADQYLSGKKGSIVVMNPQNGEVYAMASRPNFDPSTIRENWEEIVENTESPLLNRATMGLYTPGSVFKVITATAALENNVNTEFNCQGSVNIDGYILRDYNEIAHGNIDLEGAMAESCNVSFSQIGIELGPKNLKDYSEKYMFNRKISFDLKVNESSFPYKGNMSKPELGASAIGQGKIVATPLNMAMVASAIANEGIIVQPMLVKEITAPNGRTLKTNKVENISRVSSLETAKRIKDMMVKVVSEGTGKNARIEGISVAGKTGTAENETGKEHAWFIGFAPAENPKVAVAVVLENIGSTGGKVAAPIAKSLIQQGLKIQ